GRLDRLPTLVPRIDEHPCAASLHRFFVADVPKPWFHSVAGFMRRACRPIVSAAAVSWGAVWRQVTGARNMSDVSSGALPTSFVLARRLPSLVVAARERLGRRGRSARAYARRHETATEGTHGFGQGWRRRR